MKRTLLLSVFFFFCSIASFAGDTIVVHKDARLDVLSSKQAMVNKLTSNMTSSGQYKGYRLQVLNTRSRDEAFKLKAQLMESFPSQKAYIVYQAPYFKVRIGDFVQKDDAISFRARYEKKYNQNAYIVQDIIEYTPGDDDYPMSN